MRNAHVGDMVQDTVLDSPRHCVTANSNSWPKLKLSLNNLDAKTPV